MRAQWMVVVCNNCMRGPLGLGIISYNSVSAHTVSYSVHVYLYIIYLLHIVRFCVSELRTK